MLKKNVLSFILCLSLISFSQVTYAGGSGEYNPTESTMSHIQDANAIYLFTGVTIPLPVIFYVPGEGLTTGLSNGFDDPSSFNIDYHGHTTHPTLDKGDMKTLFTGESGYYYDFSPTKNVTMMLIASLLLIFIFFSISKTYQKREGQPPKGLQSFFEPLIVFIRDEVAEPNIPGKSEKFLPYLLTVFFFIWTLNMFGLVPIIGSPNVTGNIAVTMVLALMTLLIVNLNGNKHYWGHIFWMPGVPVALKPVMAVLEFVGVLTKPFALMIRLFANITAGHIIILSLVSLIFIFGKAGASLGGASAGAAIAVPFVLFMSVLELLVAFLQAFIFTLLSALFIGQAVEEHH